VLPLLPAGPVLGDFGDVLADGEVDVDVDAEVDDGGGDLATFVLTEALADGHGRLDDRAAARVSAGPLAGPELPPSPGAGVLLPGAGDGDPVGDVESGGGVVVGGPLGLGLVEPVRPAGGLDLPAAAGVVHVGRAGPGWVTWPLGAGPLDPIGVAPPFAPPPALPPPCWVEPLFAAPFADVLELGETTWGSSVTAKPPAATTKTAMPMPATGRIQLYRGRAWPGRPGTGRKRSTTAQKAATTGSIQRLSQAAAPADQADADSKDSIGRFSRSLIRCSPSADGSIESAAACRARRRASS
jgi:hypothetical protein